MRAGISEAISGGATASFVYDALGRRMSKTIGGTTTQFLYDRLNPVQELNGANPPAAHCQSAHRVGHRRVFRPHRLGHYLDTAGGRIGLDHRPRGFIQRHRDQLYLPTLWCDDRNGASNTNPYQFTGRENDGTGLYFNRARYYSSMYQRFVAQDPLDFSAGDTNLYAYVLNSPVVGRDPLGLLSFRWHGNWGGPGWSGGQWTKPGPFTDEELNSFKGPVDAQDACYVLHDFCYEGCSRRGDCSNSGSGNCSGGCDSMLDVCLAKLIVSGDPSADGYAWGAFLYFPYVRPLRNLCCGSSGTKRLVGYR
jgi:RHS repeat-associated protein